MHIRLAVAVLLLPVVACSSGTDQSAPDYGPRVSVYHADSGSTVLLAGISGLRSRANLVVTDADTWAQVWAEAQAPYQPQEPAPGIDFGEDGVIVAALGTSPSGGYAIAIDSIEFFASGQRVHLTRTSPATSCVSISVITNPVHMVRVPRPLDQVSFVENARVRDCP